MAAPAKEADAARPALSGGWPLKDLSRNDVDRAPSNAGFRPRNPDMGH
jgi:hypothetical protein